MQAAEIHELCTSSLPLFKVIEILLHNDLLRQILADISTRMPRSLFGPLLI